MGMEGKGEKMVVGLEESMEELRETFRLGKTRSAPWRKSQMSGILKLLLEREDEIFKALNQDLGKHPVESYRDEVGVTIKSVNLALSSIEKWMASKKDCPDFSFGRLELCVQRQKGNHISFTFIGAGPSSP